MDDLLSCLDFMMDGVAFVDLLCCHTLRVLSLSFGIHLTYNSDVGAFRMRCHAGDAKPSKNCLLEMHGKVENSCCLQRGDACHCSSQGPEVSL